RTTCSSWPTRRVRVRSLSILAVPISMAWASRAQSSWALILILEALAPVAAVAVPEAEHLEVRDAVLQLAVSAEAEVQPTQTMRLLVWQMLRFRLVLFADPAARSRTRVPGPRKPDKTSLDFLPGAGMARCGSRQVRPLLQLQQAEERAVA